MTTYFEIDEVRDREWVRLRLTGELDLGSVPELEHRLAQLRAENQAVCLDLSGLEFMDSSGIHLLMSELGDASKDGWSLTISPDLPSQISRLFRLVNLDRVLSEPALSGC